MRRWRLFLGFAAGCAVAGAALAATPQSYAALDRQSKLACRMASDLRRVEVGPPIRFSDNTGVEVRLVTGTYPRASQTVAKLCVYDRRTGRAEAQEAPADFLATSAAAPTSMPTPAPGLMMLRCGEEQFRVTFTPERADVAMPDGSRLSLANINAGGDPEMPRIYTNGRVTFQQTIEGPDRGVSFARGRMAPMRCDIAQN